MIRQQRAKRMQLCALTANEEDPSKLMVLLAEDYQNEEWVSLYQAAVTSFDNAKMAARVKVAQSAIVARIEKLSTVSEPHTKERQAITDALYCLRTLERELHPRSAAHET